MSTDRIQFHQLTFVEERDGVTVGRPDAGTYVVLPADGAALLHRLDEGMPVGDAASWYRDTFGGQVDIDDFVISLRELGFVRTAGETPVESASVGFRRLGRAAFSVPAWICYLAIVFGSMTLMVARPELRPSATNLFFTPSLIAVQLTLVAAQVPAVLWHEWFHFLAARRLGLWSRLSVGRRLYYVVVETHLDGLHSVRPRQRYLPLLSGMLGDALLFGALLLGAAADLDGGLSLPGRVALALAYTALLRIAWQFYVFLRTDLYYVLTTALGCTNLHEVTSAWLRIRFSALPWVRPPAADPTTFSSRDRRLAPWFALLTVGGVGFLLATLVFAALPILAEFGSRLLPALSQGLAAGVRFWDSVASLLLLGLEVVVLPVLAGRSSRRAAR